MIAENNSTAEILKELTIKAAVLNELRLKGRIDKSSTIANEFRIGSSGVRADFAILSDCFIGVEIKSKFDGLRRLERQLPVYRSTFEYNILVLASRHMKNISSFDLEGFEIWEVAEDRAIIPRKTLKRKAEREEKNWENLLTIQEKRKIDKGQIISYKEAFFSVFRNKYGSTSEVFWNNISQRDATPIDIIDLSLYRHRRLAQNKWAEDQEERWKVWLNKVKTLNFE